MVSAAARKRRTRKRARALSEEPMAPQSERIELPSTLTLEPRRMPAPNREETHLIRDARGNVLAEVEVWTPDLPN